MERGEFEELVFRAVQGIPDEFQDLLENIEIVVQDWPSRSQIRKLRLRDKYDLLGLYEGTPRTERDQRYNLVPPDRITIFQGPLESECRNSAELQEEVARVVKHEIAHYFGLDEARLEEIEKGGGD